MGILNITPDSFSDGGQFFSTDAAFEQAKQMIKEGADIIDIGGESTRPGSAPVSEAEELRRVLPVIELLVKERISIPISIDTYKPRVAQASLERGARLVNDVSGLRNKKMIEVVAQFEATVIIMHMQGEPKTMQLNPTYTNVISEIKTFFQDQIKAAQASGIKNIILDPGLGFGKTLAHNCEILRRLNEFTDIGYPILLGASRKSFIGALNDDTPVNNRLAGTIAAHIIAIQNGASIIRVHDVAAHRQAVQVIEGISETQL